MGLYDVNQFVESSLNAGRVCLHDVVFGAKYVFLPEVAYHLVGEVYFLFEVEGVVGQRGSEVGLMVSEQGQDSIHINLEIKELDVAFVGSFYVLSLFDEMRVVEEGSSDQCER